MQTLDVIAANQRPAKSASSDALVITFFGANSARAETILNALVADSRVKSVQPLTTSELDSTDRKVRAMLLGEYLASTEGSCSDMLICALQDSQTPNSDSTFINRLKSRTQNYAACTDANIVAVAKHAHQLGIQHIAIISATPFHDHMGSLMQVLSKQESEITQLDWASVTIIRTVVPYAAKQTGSWLARFANLWQRQLEYMVPEQYASLTSKEIAQAVRHTLLARVSAIEVAASADAEAVVKATSNADLSSTRSKLERVSVLSALDLRAVVKLAKANANSAL